MICYAKLSDSSLATAKLKKLFLKVHGDEKYKNNMLAEFKIKKARFDENAAQPVFWFVPINKPILTPSYKVAYLIAKQGEPHTIGEKLIKPTGLKVAKISCLEKQPKIGNPKFLFGTRPSATELIR